MSRIKWFAMVLVLIAPALALAAPDDSVRIVGTLSNDDPKDPVRREPAKVHEVKLSGGKAYQIDLVSVDFDSYLRLVDSTGREVAKDDDGGGMRNARIRYTPERDDTFKVVVTRFGFKEGAYTLTVVGGVGGPVVAKTQPEVLLNVEGNVQLNDNPDPARNNPCKVHEVKLKKGVAYQLDMISKTNNFDPYLRLVDDQGSELARDDDGGGFPNARIVFTPTKDGDFKIYATSFGGGSGGYLLTVKSIGGGGKVADGKPAELPAPAAANPTQHAGAIAANDAPDPVRRRPAKVHTIELKAGKTYVIDLNSQFDNYLRLEGPDGAQLAQDDDGGEGLNARIVFTCPTDGRYRIIATSFNGSQGPYTLRVAEQ